MSFKQCITNAVGDGDITEKEAVYVRDLFDALYIDKQKSMGSAQAESAAAAETLAKMKADQVHSKRNKLLQMKLYDDMVDTFRNHGTRPGQALIDSVSALDYYKKAVRANLYSEMSQVIATFRHKAIGRGGEKALMNDVVSALFDPDAKVSPAARELAEGWRSAAETGRKRLNAAGMRIPYLKNWGLPQVHESKRIRDVTVDEWVEFIFPRLDIDAMRDNKSNLPWNKQTLTPVLANIYKDITQGQHQDILKGVRGKALHNQRLDHRFLKFKDANAWLEYQERFGNPDTLSNMTTHIDSLARDITLLENFSGNYRVFSDGLKGWVRTQAAKTNDNKLVKKAEEDLVIFDRNFKYFLHGEQTANDWVAGFFGGTRDLVSAALLGGAPITAVSDLNTQMVAARMTGTPYAKLLKRIIQEIPIGKEGVEMATHMGLIMESAILDGAANVRYTGDALGPVVTRRIADVTHRMSGLTGWTNVTRRAFGKEFMVLVGKNADKGFDDIHPRLRETFERNNISREDWEIARQTKVREEQGVKYMRFIDISERQDLNELARNQLSSRFGIMLEREMDLATPIPNLKSRLAVTGGSIRGTASGELLRGVGMFKQFPVTILLNNIMTYANAPGKAKYSYLAQFFIVGTIMGAGILQSKQILNGKQTRPMDNVDFWVQSVLQFGGLGIFGDFLFQNLNRYGKGLEETIAGPQVSLFADAINLSIGNIMQAVKGERTNFGREVVDFAQRYTPGSTIWYLRLGFERMVIDEMLEAVDPKAKMRFRKAARKYKKNYDTGFWWERGQGANFGAITE
tara:strand:- start:423 stop:2822 length:2400 start_codon:yes stop_codon:yes gene_type:complete